jgi:uncharacterized protein
MRDMFDDFLDELRRRQAEQGGKTGANEPTSEGHPAADSGTGPADRQAGDGPTEDKPVTSYGEDSGGGDDERDSGPHVGRGGGNFGRPRGFGGGNYGGEMPEIHVSRFWVVAGIVALVLLVAVSLFLSVGVGIWTDAIWYQSVGYADVFWTRIGSQVGLFALGALGTFAFLWFNVWISGRMIPKGEMRRFSIDDFLDRFNLDRYASQMGNEFSRPRRPTGRPSESIEMPNVARPVFWVLLGIAALIALGLGGLMASSWTTVQLFTHKVSFAQTDPTFGLNIGFFVFELPFYRLLQALANTLLLISIVLVGVRYLVAVISGASMPTRARAHVGILVALFLITIAIGFQLDRYSLVYSGQSGIFQGASYTDVNAKFMAINVMTVLAAFAGSLFLLFCLTRWWVPLTLTIVVWIGAYVALVFAYPLITQRISVDPNQQGQESQYLADNIKMTRLGFDLSTWSDPVAYSSGTSIDQSALTNEQSTIQNLRLWDYRPLGPTLNNMQLIRNYYSFGDVDTDRYTFTSAAGCAPNPAPCVRQVMLAGRELDPSKVTSLNNGNSSCVNQHLIYTHGIGLAMLPVNEVVRSSTGQSANPLLVIQNVPPASSPGAPVITEPRIYFGTQTNADWVVVGGATQEFDYPSSTGTSGDAYNTWTGTSGIKLDTTMTKLLFSLRFGDLNMLISNQVSGGSQLLMRRSIQERVQAIAPYLRYDKDPYLVVTASGRLDYVLDAYTTSDAFPDANTFDPGADTTISGLAGDPFNYIRNSVKVVMDAYDGSLTFYVADPSDPMIRAWEGVFPTVYHPLSQMSSDLQSHLRYPEDLFDAQTTVFEKYHVTDPGVFYQGNDVWQVARNSGSGGSGAPAQLPLEAYYVEMQAPGATDVQSSEFLLLQPMVLSGRPNMISWVAAHNDPSSYGKVSIYDFPRDSTIYGPAQMSALIMQNPIISQQLTLWSQQGSTVTMGNLLVVPLQKSILYVQPVYMASNTNPLPVLQKVIVATPSQIVWGDTLQEALTLLVAGGGQTPGASPTPGSSVAVPTPGPTATPAGTPGAGPSLPANPTVQQLIAAADAYYNAAQTALHNGDLATYQADIAKMEALIKQLQGLLGTPAP